MYVCGKGEEHKCFRELDRTALLTGSDGSRGTSAPFVGADMVEEERDCPWMFLTETVHRVTAQPSRGTKEGINT